MKAKAALFDLFETLITEFTDGKRKTMRNYDYMFFSSGLTTGHMTCRSCG